MCGIFGIIGLNAPVPAELLERATQSLAHRGPDDGGTVILQDSAQEVIEVGLGNRRLAILDLSPQGHQPMNDPATGNWIVYNGEVYNFREVRAKLEREGLRFSSNSDTEVILKAYGHWGEECLHEFRGMFAFAVWDAQRHRLFVARDPMGIKPLYFWQSDRYFMFSSEVRTLLGTGLVPRRIDPAGLVNYLTFGSLYDPNTLVEGVNALPPGCYLTWENGQVKQVQYWDLIDLELVEACHHAGDCAENRGELEAQIAEMLEESVRMQLVSDVPVGVFLSGGIDSSSLVGILSRSGVLVGGNGRCGRRASFSRLADCRRRGGHAGVSRRGGDRRVDDNRGGDWLRWIGSRLRLVYRSRRGTGIRRAVVSAAIILAIACRCFRRRDWSWRLGLAGIKRACSGSATCVFCARVGIGVVLGGCLVGSRVRTGRDLLGCATAVRRLRAPIALA